MAAVRDFVNGGVAAEPVAEVIRRGWYRRFGGHMWAAWPAFFTFFRDVCRLENVNWEPLEIIEKLTRAGWSWMHREFCIVCDRPELVRYERVGEVGSVPVPGLRLHCEDGPSVRWRDGWSLWHIHGVAVDEQIVLRPHTQTIEQIRGEQNEEVRRIRIERYGWDRYLREVGAVVVDTRRNDIEATREALMRTPDGETVLVCACPSTARVYALEVPSEIQTCEAAQAWLSGGLSARVVNAA
jgi:hypothetical protein